MSKHLKQLKKLNKRVLGLNSESLTKEIDVLIKRSAELPELKFTASENVKAAEVLTNMVDKYHLKETLLIKDEKTGDIGLPTNSSQLTNIKESVFVELSAKCSTVSVIDSAKKRVDSFFNLDVLSKNELDSETSSGVINYVRFIQNASNYSYDSMYYYFLELLEKGEIKINLSKEEKIPSEETFTQVEKMILSYRDTFIKNYVSYLPTFMEYKTSLQTELDYGYGKYVARIKEGEQLTREDAIS